jgi:hypothetical protein
MRADSLLFKCSWTHVALRRMSPNAVVEALYILDDGLLGLGVLHFSGFLTTNFPKNRQSNCGIGLKY